MYSVVLHEKLNSPESFMGFIHKQSAGWYMPVFPVDVVLPEEGNSREESRRLRDVGEMKVNINVMHEP